MLTDPRKRAILELFLSETVAQGRAYWWRPRGLSMAPVVRDGDRVLVGAADQSRLRAGDIVKFEAPDGFRLHRLIRRSRRADGALEFGFQGDNSPTPDPPVDSSQIVGVALAVDRWGRIERLDTWRARFRGRLRIVKRWLRQRLKREVPAGTTS